MIFTNPAFRLVWLVLALLTSACSSNIPIEIRQAPVGAPSVSQVRDQPLAHTSKAVRWGGRILKVVNDKHVSKLTIVTFPLFRDGKPQSDKPSTGRFIATADYFLEPQEYKVDKLITINGDFSHTETIDIGEYPYVYPVINIKHAYLWPKEIVRDHSHYPAYWYHNPWHYQRHYRTTPAISGIILN